jgi:hypothetical protein
MFYGIGSVGPLPLRKVMSLSRCSQCQFTVEHLHLHSAFGPATILISFKIYLFTDSPSRASFGGKIFALLGICFETNEIFCVKF